MSVRKIAPIQINGKTIWIEVEDIEMTKSNLPKTNGPTDLRESAKPVGAIDTLKEKVATVSETVEAVVGSIGEGIDKIKPDEWSVELTLGFAGEKNVPFIAKGSINGGVKITVTWKK